jgi:hypothetical protein
MTSETVTLHGGLNHAHRLMSITRLNSAHPAREPGVPVNEWHVICHGRFACPTFSIRNLQLKLEFSLTFVGLTGISV